MSILRPPCLEGSGTEASVERDVAPFTAVSLETEATVTLQQGSEQSVEITSDDNILPIITTEVSGGTLTIAETECYSTRLGVAVAITLPTLDGITVSSSGKVQGTGMSLSSASLKVSASGSITLDDVTAESLDVRLSASGSIEVSGTSGSMTVDSSASGGVTADSCEANSADVTVSGSGNVRVFATDTLKATITASGNIYYRGTPTIQENISGSGKLIQIT